MISHLVAFILGVVVATIGLVPVAQLGDQGVQKIQEVTRSTLK